MSPNQAAKRAANAPPLSATPSRTPTPASRRLQPCRKNATRPSAAAPSPAASRTGPIAGANGAPQVPVPVRVQVDSAREKAPVDSAQARQVQVDSVEAEAVARAHGLRVCAKMGRRGVEGSARRRGRRRRTSVMPRADPRLGCERTEMGMNLYGVRLRGSPDTGKTRGPRSVEKTAPARTGPRRDGPGACAPPTQTTPAVGPHIRATRPRTGKGILSAARRTPALTVTT
ncbi:hypothetical protein B0H14DRAFT_355955 [Mycena olivaceomarginata]|nr:hypothetical protein B0H14DRAFT_355955 [Mycena olivaceomarginata]